MNRGQRRVQRRGGRLRQLLPGVELLTMTGLSPMPTCWIWIASMSAESRCFGKTLMVFSPPALRGSTVVTAWICAHGPGKQGKLYVPVSSVPLTTIWWGRQPAAVVGGLVCPPQCLSPKLSLLPQWYHQVTSYIPSAGAETLLNWSQPLNPWVSQWTCPPPEE